MCIIFFQLPKQLDNDYSKIKAGGSDEVDGFAYTKYFGKVHSTVVARCVKLDRASFKTIVVSLLNNFLHFAFRFAVFKGVFLLRCMWCQPDLCLLALPADSPGIAKVRTTTFPHSSLICQSLFTQGSSHSCRPDFVTLIENEF